MAGFFHFAAKAAEEAHMQFHFSLADGKSVADKGVQELEDAVQAGEAADVLAKRVAREKPDLVTRNFAIVVSDEDGEEVYRARLAENAG
jgi:hypothetical protein